MTNAEARGWGLGAGDTCPEPGARSPEPRRGFTIVELLVSLALIALVGGTVVATFAGGIRVWERLQAQGSQDQWFEVAFEQFRHDLRNMRRFQLVPIKGAYDRISFPAIVESDTTDGRTVGEIGELGYFFNSSRRMLCRAGHPYRTLRYQRLTDDCHPVVTGVDRVQLSFYKYDEETRQGDWSSSWEEETPPLAVKLELGYQDRSTRRMITQSLVVHVPLADTRKAAEDATRS